MCLITQNSWEFWRFKRPKAFYVQLSILFAMGRKRGFDNQKIARIIGILASNPDGIWIRRIAGELKLSPTTVTKYMDTILKPMVEDVSLGSHGKPILRVIRLKPFVIERLNEGKSVTDILKILRLMSKVM